MKMKSIIKVVLWAAVLGRVLASTAADRCSSTISTSDTTEDCRSGCQSQDYCFSGTGVTLDCDSSQACKDSNFTWLQGSSARTMDCSNTDACENVRLTLIDANVGYENRLRCTRQNSCKDMLIELFGNSTLRINCEGISDSDRPCAGMEIFIPDTSTVGMRYDDTSFRSSNPLIVYLFDQGQFIEDPDEVATPGLNIEVITQSPTTFPTEEPTLIPSVAPSKSPSQFPSASPESSTTQPPSNQPTSPPAESPESPTDGPSATPAAVQSTFFPTQNPISNDAVVSTLSPTSNPNGYPTLSTTEATPEMESKGRGKSDLAPLAWVGIGIGGTILFGALCYGLAKMMRSVRKPDELEAKQTDMELQVQSMSSYDHSPPVNTLKAAPVNDESPKNTPKETNQREEPSHSSSVEELYENEGQGERELRETAETTQTPQTKGEQKTVTAGGRETPA